MATDTDRPTAPLFKYLPPARTDVLHDAMLRFSQPSVLNDPFELKPHISQFQRPEQVSEEADQLLAAQIQALYKALPEHARRSMSMDEVTAFVKARVPMPELKTLAYGLLQTMVPGARETMDRSFNDNLGILCLTEEPTSLLMWAHYAEGHQGFVLEFDSQSPFFDQRLRPEDSLRYLRRVNYRAERPEVALTEIDETSLFLTKANEWLYEAEWRMFVALAHASEVKTKVSPPAYLFGFPRSMVRRVILGCRMSEGKRTEIHQILAAHPEYKDIPCVQARIDDVKYRLLIPGHVGPDRALGKGP